MILPPTSPIAPWPWKRRWTGILSIERLSGPGPAAERLVAAMRHGSLNGGKRLRPLLVRQAANIFGVPAGQALIAGLAVEAVHCYSLIHDDLPAMDDDDLRRGQPTVHKAYDDATAILAGDALLTHAFGLLASPDCHPDADDPHRPGHRTGGRQRRRRHGGRADARYRGGKRRLFRRRHQHHAGDEDRRADPRQRAHGRHPGRRRSTGAVGADRLCGSRRPRLPAGRRHS